MLYRWARWLKSGMRYKNQGTSKVRFLEAFQNKDLITQTNDSCEQNGLITESGDVVLNLFPDNTEGIYSPEWISFKSVLRWDVFQSLKDKLRGEGTGSDNYGYIRILNPEGVEEKVWPYEIRYNISRQECTFRTLKANL